MAEGRDGQEKATSGSACLDSKDASVLALSASYRRTTRRPSRGRPAALMDARGVVDLRAGPTLKAITSPRRSTRRSSRRTPRCRRGCTVIGVARFCNALGNRTAPRRSRRSSSTRPTRAPVFVASSSRGAACISYLGRWLRAEERHRPRGRRPRASATGSRSGTVDLGTIASARASRLAACSSRRVRALSEWRLLPRSS